MAKPLVPMKPASQKLIFIGMAVAVLATGLTFVFRFVYEPELALRAVQRQEHPDDEELARLFRLAKAGQFDLTDTLRLAHMLEETSRIDDALDVFQALHERYSETPIISLWYAERLQKYGRWQRAETIYLGLLELLDRNNNIVQHVERRVWRAREQELAVAQRAGGIPESLEKLSKAEVYRKLAENAMSAGMAATDETRASWLAKSENYFVECLAVNQDNPEVRGAYANLLLQVDKPGESLRNYQMLLESNPDDLGWLVSAAIAAGADGRFAAAERYVRDALRVENRSEWRLELARFMSWGGKHDAAINEINALIDENPESIEYRLERADLLLNAERHREYLADTARLAAMNPADLDLRLNRVKAMIGLRLYQDAAQEALAVLAIDPYHKEATLLKAEALLWSGEYEAAQVDLLILSERAPEDRIVLKRLAQSRLWNKDYEGALRVFRKLNPAAMDDVEVAQGFAEAVAGRKAPTDQDIDAVMAMYRIVALDMEANWPVPLLAAIGRALREVGENDAAVQLLNSATQRAATNLRLRLELADLLQAIGRHEEAARQYRLITDKDKKETIP